MSKKEIYESVANSGIGWIDFIFDRTVDFLIFLGNITGLGYEIVNVFILLLIVIMMPISVMLNLYLYKKYKNIKNKYI